MRSLLAIAFAVTLLGAGIATAQGASVPVCNVVSGHTHACALTWIEGPIANIDDSVPSAREGRACAWNVLALVAVGDVRVSTAKRNGGITRVASVEYDSFELVPYWQVYSRYCTVVRGD